MCELEALIFMNRRRDTVRKIDPMITCRPWNPVAIKKVDPNAESAMQNGASVYSKPWNSVNTAPNVMVRANALVALAFILFIMAWCAHVTETPEDRRRMVFSSGILIGLKELIDMGGHIWPSSTVGEILLWKNAQKKETKNNTSERINNTIPVFRPFITMSEWFPWEVDSRWMSRHHI
jgi:hypothetical protein